MDSLSLITGLVAGFAAAWWLKPSQTAESPAKQAKLAAVMNLARKRGRITNDDVEQTFGISNTSAERYLDELEQTGKLKQIGTAGRAVYYEPQ
jgi:predicted HTH transcriptional regulator